jgi:hypothetical protein
VPDAGIGIVVREGRSLIRLALPIMLIGLVNMDADTNGLSP